MRELTTRFGRGSGCRHERELRRAVAIVRPAATPGRSRYVAFVRNTGRSAADDSALSVAFGGAALPFAPVLALEPGEGVEVTVEGPACEAGEPVDADADAGDAVDEGDEADNRFTRLCPPPS